MRAMKINEQEAIKKVYLEHREYRLNAYRLLYSAACPDSRKHHPAARYEPEHISVPQYYKALISLAKKKYDFLAYHIFCYFGLETNADIAIAVQHLVKGGLLQLDPGENTEDICLMPPLEEQLEIRTPSNHTRS